jgi:NADH oxidase (H2O2-forming)
MEDKMKSDIVVIGGGPAGIITALTAKSVYPDKSVCIVKEIGDGVIPCAIPYMVETIKDPKQNIMTNKPLEDAGIDIKVGKVESLDVDNHLVIVSGGDFLSYEKLVLATGTDVVIPPIQGVHLTGVYTIQKSLSSLTTLREKIKAARNVVIIGGGFIGVEFADELSKITSVSVHLIEVMPKLLYHAFDNEFCDDAAQILSLQGVNIHNNCRVLSIDGDTDVTSVTLENGMKIPADLVLISIGAKPSIELAQKAGLRIAENDSIWVDEYMRTSVDDIFAVGDCALKRDFFTRKAVPVWLASTATAEARNAGTNIYGIRVMHQIQGTVAAFSTQIGGFSLASAGMTCRFCQREGFRNVSATAKAPDRHPGILPGASMMKVKLVFADRSGIILGGQASGGVSVGEIINVIALAIQKKVTVRELDMLQIATHPLLTSAPTMHPLVNAAHQALAEMRSTAKT